MTQFSILECSIDVDNYVNLVLIDKFDNVQQITIHTCNRDDDISMLSDEIDNEFEFSMHRHTLDSYQTLIA